ncbi:MAG: hypothetical protein JXN61_09015 [Sedimentisphaerales bacterium]|nr:hypothetical protein [Sedimentisphaerales bacterium]
MDDQQKKRKAITNLTLSAVFMAGVYFWFDFICDDTNRQNLFVTAVLVLPRLAVLACTLGVLLAMRGWCQHWIIKLAVIFVLALPFITFVIARWAFSFIP